MYCVAQYTYMSTPKIDDLEAVRVVVEAIKDFKPDEQQRILRWVAEKVNLPQPFAASAQALPLAQSSGAIPQISHHPVTLPASGGWTSRLSWAKRNSQ